MHVVALVWGDERVAGHVARRQVGLELAEVHGFSQSGWAALYIGEGNERVVLSLVKLIAARVGKHESVAQ